MPLTNSQYSSLMRLYDEIQTNNRHIKERRYEEVTALCPAIADVDSEIIDLSMKAARNRILADSSDTTTDELSLDLSALQNKRHMLLSSIGKPADYLDDIYTCKDCKDSGYINGHKCHCFHKKAIDLVYSDSNLKNITDNENFNTFSYKWYNNTDIDPATGLTPYNNMHKVYDICMKFVENFDNQFSNLLLTGQTGVGKTFLTNCIAKELLDSSHSIIYLTAMELFNIIRNQYKDFSYTTEEPESDYFLECDLLIIDDLGTENPNSFTTAQLFYIVNERLLRKKSVIISTNLSISEIEDLYTERIFSRIVSSYDILKLFGDDIRCLKRKDKQI